MMTQRDRLEKIGGVADVEGGFGRKKPPKLSWTHLVAVASTAATFIQLDDYNNS